MFSHLPLEELVAGMLPRGATLSITHRDTDLFGRVTEHDVTEAIHNFRWKHRVDWVDIRSPRSPKTTRISLFAGSAGLLAEATGTSDSRVLSLPPWLSPVRLADAILLAQRPIVRGHNVSLRMSGSWLSFWLASSPIENSQTVDLEVVQP